MLENMSSIKETIEKETLSEFDLLTRVREFTAAGVYLSEGRRLNIPLFQHSRCERIEPWGNPGNLQLFFETEMFGQYISRIFCEINQDVGGRI
ncbi:MAG: hypothetical protein PVH61_36615 [Candidatus Aminicenantes bacterium]|jgi:hypothetical protein